MHLQTEMNQNNTMVLIEPVQRFGNELNYILLSALTYKF